jgi:hypothetical protein
MDYDQIEQRLVIAEQHATDGARHIEQQIRLIDELQRGGHDATQARQLLETMKEAQAMHEDERDRLALLLGVENDS